MSLWQADDIPDDIGYDTHIVRGVDPINDSDVGWRNSIFTRLLVTFLIIIIPIYMLGVTIYNWGIGTVRNEIFNSMKAQVYFYLNDLEQEIKRIRMLQLDCVTDEDLNRLAATPGAMDDIEKVQVINRIQRRLSVIKDISPYIINVRVHIPSIDRTIYAKGSISELLQEDYDALKSAETKSDSQIIYWKNKLFLSIVYPLPPFIHGSSPLFLLDIELSAGQIKSALSRLLKFDDSEAMLINLDEDYSISTVHPNEEFNILLKQQVVNSNKEVDSIEINGKKYLLIHSKSDYLKMTLVDYMPEKQVFLPLKKYEVWFWIVLFMAFVIIIVFSMSTYKFIQQPLIKLVNAFRKLENGDLDISIKHNHKDEFGYLCKKFDAMVKKLGVLIDQVYKQKILMQHAELKQLQSQINPHFLYNSFFTLHRRIKGGDYDNAIKFSQQLGNYFRFITRSAADEVPLSMEVEHARIYADIQSIRFSNRIRVEFEELPEEYINIIVPRLILQPVIENAFNHGLEGKEESGTLKVDFKVENGKLNIIIEDNGETLQDSDIEKLRGLLASNDVGIENTGILNIHKRIRLKFGEKSGVMVSRGALGGLRTDIIIILKGEDIDV